MPPGGRPGRSLVATPFLCHEGASRRGPTSRLMTDTTFLIGPLFFGFSWFDDGLQAFLKSRGWPRATRAQSIVMLYVINGVTKPVELARRLGVSRQAVQITINQMVAKGLLALEDDPTDRRSKRVIIAPDGQKMRALAQQAVTQMCAALEVRIGAENVEALRRALGADWGSPYDMFADRPLPAAGSR
jgi:DNA-binding MarR family transcriptional regulator